MIIANLNRLLFGTLRRQLIIGVAAVHALMMALFIVDLTRRQEAFLLDRQAEQATALAHSLATSASDWLASHDISGLQELAESQRRYPELQFAMLLDSKGLVLAHTDRSRLGQYVRDLPAQVQQTTVGRSPALVDVIVPAMLVNRHVGWARVGIGQQLAEQRLAEITRNGMLYALAAILTGSLLAWFMGRWLTSRLYSLRSTMDEVRTGNSTVRSRLPGIDEAADLSAGFDAMLDAMTVLNAELQGSEERFRSLFENSPVSIWEEDFSTVKGVLDALKEQGIDNIETYLGLHPEVVQQCAGAVRVIDINLATVRLHEATDKAELRQGLANTFTPESYAAFREELIALWHGETVLVRDTVVKTLAGKPRYVTLYFSVCPGHEQTLSRIMVSLVDITERKRAEEDLAERVMLAELSAEIGYALTMSGELRNMLNDCAQALVGHLDAAFARIWTLNAAENVLELQASAGMYTRTDGSHSRVPVGSFKIGLIALELKPHLTNEVIGDPLVHDQDWAKREGMVSFAGHPLIIEEKLVGVMALFSRHPLTDTSLKALAAVSNEIAIGIERKQAEDALSRLNEELEQRVKERTDELESKNADLEKMNKMFVGRELRMVELKERISQLENEKSGLQA